MPQNRSRPARLRPHLAGRLLVSALLSAVAVDPCLAQAVDLGAAVTGGSGLRGTTDATGSDLADDGIAKPETANTANLAKQSPVLQRFQLPKLRNQAIPERYPVQLSKLLPYPRALRAKGAAAEADDLDGTNHPTPSTAALGVVLRRQIKADENPFGPIGYGVGGLRVLPYIEQSIGYDSNPEQVSTGVKGSAYSRTEGGFTAQSDWSSYDFRAVMHGAYDDFFSNPGANRPDADGVVTLRADVTRQSRIDAEARFNIDTQRPGSPELNVAVRDRPLITSFGGTVGGTQDIGRFSVGLHGLVDRTVYEDGVLTNGTPVNLAYQNFTDYGLKVRVGYDLKPGLQPFAEFGVDRRIHDDLLDPGGYRRDSDGIGGRIGASFEFLPQLTGTASVGYADRQYDDERLKNLAGPTVNAALIWGVTPLTTVTLNGATSFNETTVIGASGIESRVIGVAISHALFRYLTVTGSIAYQRDQYDGAPITENTLTASLKAEYHLSRSLVLTGTLSRQQLMSTVKGSDYTQNVALVGVRLQH